MIIKKVEFNLVVDWKTKDCRVVRRKSMLSHLGNYEIPLKVYLNFKIPEKEPSYMINTDIDIPEAQITQAMIEKLDI